MEMSLSEKILALIHMGFEVRIGPSLEWDEIEVRLRYGDLNVLRVMNIAVVRMAEEELISRMLDAAYDEMKYQIAMCKTNCFGG